MTTDADQPTSREILARIQALEAWRAHHTDILDDLVNGTRTTPLPDPGHTASAAAEQEPSDAGLAGDELIDWVHAHVTAVIARALRGELKWCPLWWEHTEAVFRFEALRRAWSELAVEPGAAMSTWIRDHLDPCLRELLHPLGPFADCGHNERFRVLGEHRPLPTLPTADPPTPR